MKKQWIKELEKEIKSNDQYWLLEYKPFMKDVNEIYDNVSNLKGFDVGVEYVNSDNELLFTIVNNEIEIHLFYFYNNQVCFLFYKDKDCLDCEDMITSIDNAFKKIRKVLED